MGKKILTGLWRFVFGMLLFWGLWLGATFLGMQILGDTDAVIIPSVGGMFIGVQLCLTAWTDNWDMWKR